MNNNTQTVEELIPVVKAGIIKQKIPVIIGEKRTETEKVFSENAKRKNAPLFSGKGFSHDYDQRT